MATTGPYYSTEYTALYRTLPADNAVARNKRSHKRIEYFSYTKATIGTAGDDLFLCKVPGVCRILLPELFLYFSAGGGTATVDIGHGAYTEVDGDAVAENKDALVDGLDISAAGVFFGMVLGVTTTHTVTVAPAATFSVGLNSRHPVDIFIDFPTDAPADGLVIEGYLTYVI